MEEQNSSTTINETVENVQQELSDSTGNESLQNKVCSKCNTPIKQGQNFCSKCGEAVYCIDAECSQICSFCGAELTENMLFCPKCGKATQKNENVTNKKFKGIFFIIGGIALALTLVIVFSIVIGLNKNKKEKKIDLQEIYDEYCSPSWANIGSDGSYLYVDTNPYNKEDGDYTYIYVVNNAIEDINKALGLPDSLLNDMNNTSWSMGKQKETYEELGVEVSWTYHPDKGKEVTYKLIENKK